MAGLYARRPAGFGLRGEFPARLAFGAYCETGRSLFSRDVIRHDFRSGRQLVVSQLIINFVGELHWPAEASIGTGITLPGLAARVTVGTGTGTLTVIVAELAPLPAAPVQVSV